MEIQHLEPILWKICLALYVILFRIKNSNNTAMTNPRGNHGENGWW